MKKNAVVIAGIMFVAGCASNQSGYRTAHQYNTAPMSDVAMSRSTEMVARSPQGDLIPPSDPALAAQYDPASGGFGTSVSGSSSSSYSAHNPQSSVDDFHADSSVRGGSNEARGVARLHVPTEGTPHPIDPSVQADSSIRGGSPYARHADRDIPAEPPVSSQGSSIKADSSIRGGSNQARFPHQSSNFGSSGHYESGRSLNSSSSLDGLGSSHSADWQMEKSGSLRDSANWNPSDDLLPDGTRSDRSNEEINSDASLAGAINGTRELNSSGRMERNIAGQYSLDERGSGADASVSVSGLEQRVSGEVPSDSSFSSESVGGPGSVQTGVSSSSSQSYDTTVLDTPAVSDVPDSTRSGSELFRNNRAQGVGSAATGEFGVATSGGTITPGTESQLAQQVKATLMRESSGAQEMMKPDIARNIQVSSHGGTIILQGTVPSQKYKDLIEIRAREITGVQRVDNQLTVTPEADSALRDANIGRDLEDKTDSLQSIERNQQ